jgi:hypothetical protein
MIDYTQFFKKWFGLETPINAKKASVVIGAGDNGTVTARYDLVGTAGNDYTLEVDDTNSGTNNAAMSATLTGTDILVELGTDPNASASTTIGSGANGVVTVGVDATGTAGNDYTIAVVDGAANGNLGAALAGSDLTVTLGMDAGTAATTTIGTGDNGVVTITADVVGDAGNDLTVEVVTTATVDANLAAVINDGAIVVTLGATPASSATATIGSGADGVVTVSAIPAGIAGNGYTIEVVVGIGENAPLTALLSGTELSVILGTNGAGTLDNTKNTATLVAGVITALAEFNAVASGTGATPITLAEVEKSFTGGLAGGDVSSVKNTATLVAGAIHALAGVTAVASGTGATPLLIAEAEKNFTGGIDIAPDDAKNTATLVAAAINDGTAGLTATASGNGSTSLTVTVAQKNFTGGKTSGAISSVKNTATLIAAAISALDGFTATASGTGADSITAAEAVQDFENGQLATPVGCACFIKIGDVYYVTNGAVTKYDESGWYSGTPA